MPPLAAEAGLASRIVSHKEIMLSLAGLSLLLLTLLLGRVSATVVLMTSTNETLQFSDMESSFGSFVLGFGGQHKANKPDSCQTAAARIPAAGILGVIYAAEPANACTTLTNAPIPERGLFSSFVVVSRGDCTFEKKVRVAQAAGFHAVIVYNNEDNHDLVTMSGNGAGIRIHAVFVSKSSGEAILSFADDVGTSCYIRPAFENTAWSVMAVSFISLLAVAAVLATFFFVRRHRLRHLGNRLLQNRESQGMSSTEVKALPIIIFKCIGDGNEFHTACIDQWLMTRRPFCPICKRDAHTKTTEPPASENTPLLGASMHLPVPTVTSIAATQTSPSGSPVQSGSRSLGLQTSHSYPGHGGDLC
ncbi:hypothetical protein AXG93_1050s1040 [Marchantia polymorpha subsp. ruderalis]|uniref:RING-type E3 ubiquitin transferase n=1 Tax=Marchantia polymorpha subsp. ruderalis TaxID=1480154 RepID=A0A176VGL1_MARPO|nr:hypothetical protein AXG93_1050s1040 [Marchantia polymorpha subsp. ruderalis]